MLQMVSEPTLAVSRTRTGQVRRIRGSRHLGEPPPSSPCPADAPTHPGAFPEDLATANCLARRPRPRHRAGRGHSDCVPRVREAPLAWAPWASSSVGPGRTLETMDRILARRYSFFFSFS
jgi:hypothetical protein